MVTMTQTITNEVGAALGGWAPEQAAQEEEAQDVLAYVSHPGRSIVMGASIKILGFAGSLRKQSYNRLALRAATRLLPPEAQLDTFELDNIPPFNQDDEREPPLTVRAFKAAIEAAAAILIVTPEYNYSVPGVLKNAIDWASRPYGDNA